MKTQFASTQNPTIAVRPGSVRSGTEHSYTLNGARLTDRFINGQWLTVKVQ